MAGLLTMSSIMMCPHGGQVTAITTNTQVRATGDFVLSASDTFIIAGCPLNIAGAPHPCLQVQWVQPAMQSKAVGVFTLTQESVGLCVAADMAVQGTVLINMTQSQVLGR